MGAFGAGVLAVLFVWLGLTIPRGEVGNFEAGAFLGSMFLEVAGCALVPAFAVAWFHRRRHVADCKKQQKQLSIISVQLLIPDN